ncbi:unnamed protein product [Ophioblennius macclurei]
MEFGLLLESRERLVSLLVEWESVQQGDPERLLSVLTRMCEVMEVKIRQYQEGNPDLFSEPQPERASMACELVDDLKLLFLNEAFISTLWNSYIVSSRDPSLNTAACRMLLNLMPGLESSFNFQEKEFLIEKLYSLAQDAEWPLSVYATGLLGIAMIDPEVATCYKEENTRLVPVMIRRLLKLQSQQSKQRHPDSKPDPHAGPSTDPHTSSTKAMSRGKVRGQLKRKNPSSTSSTEVSGTCTGTEGGGGGGGEGAKIGSPMTGHGKKSRQKLHKNGSSSRTPQESSAPGRPPANSLSQSEMSSVLTGSDHFLSPLSLATEQRLILQYLAPLGEHQELLVVFMQLDTRSLLIEYLDLSQTRSVQVTFHALRFLASLLLHKKFAADFITHGGVERLLQIPRAPSLSATGVSQCLHYLAYNQDAMERVCTLPGSVLSDMVSFALWLLDSSHSSAVCHATMFFSISFSFRVVLQLFDEQDGRRKFINLISSLDFLRSDYDESAISDDKVFFSRQTARHTCMALRKYLEAHLAVKTEQVKQTLHESDCEPVVSHTHFTKPCSYTREQIIEMMEFLMLSPAQVSWEQVELLFRQSCVPLMLQLIYSATNWTNYSGRSDTVRYVLDILSILVLVPLVQLVLGNPVHPDEGRRAVGSVGMSIVLELAEGEVIPNDGEIQKSALQVIINCVCAHDHNLYPVGSVRPPLHPQRSSDPQPPVLDHIWLVLQKNNGIKVLLSLLSAKTPITDADLIRTLACKALVGLSRSASIRQIISKLPLFTRNHIQQLMKEPVLQDKRRQHALFCQLAVELTERVSGRRLLAGSDTSLALLQKANVVAQSLITFPEKELLLLIKSHLAAKGLHRAADALSREANLPPAPLCLTPTAPPASAVPRSCRSVGGAAARLSGHVGASPLSSPHASCSSASSRSFATPQLPSTSSSTTPPPPPHTPQGSHLAGRILFPQEQRTPPCSSGKKLCALKQKSDHGAFIQTPALKKQPELHLPPPPTLDSIITKYLREQHSRCHNPVTTCPPFSLFSPHRCPEPRQRRQASPNFTVRLSSRSFDAKHPVNRGRLDRHLIFSRFRPAETYQDVDGDESGFTCCSFSACERFLILGTLTGHLRFYNMFSGEQEASHQCHTSAITNLQTSRDGKLLLTSASWGVPLSALWTMEESLSIKNSFADDHYVEFSKLSQDRVIGTKDQIAHIYDIHTGQKTLTLNDQSLGNNYKRNRATFGPSDDLVLNDGVLWDLRTSQAVHKFDKFNTNISGVFHPNSLEVIINTEIWDVRTFHLLHTVPALDQCRLVFNSSGSIIYGAMLQADDESDVMERRVKSPFGSSFRTFDAADYKPIVTFDVKRDIFDLCTDSKDDCLAVIEDQDSLSLDTVCRLYHVGRQKLPEEGHEEDEDDDDDRDDDTSSDSDDDLDDDLLIEDLDLNNVDGENSPAEDEDLEQDSDQDLEQDSDQDWDLDTHSSSS